MVLLIFFHHLDVLFMNHTSIKFTKLLEHGVPLILRKTLHDPNKEMLVFFFNMHGIEFGKLPQLVYDNLQSLPVPLDM